MSRVHPPIDATFRGDRVRYLRHYAQVYREDVVAIARNHREVTN